MKARRIPPRRILVYAQISAYVLAAALMFLLYFVGRMVLFSGEAIPTLVSTGLTALVLFIGGMALSALQSNNLRKWFPQRTEWLVLSGLALIVLAGFVAWLLDPFFISSPAPQKWLGANFAWTAAGEVIGQWSLVSGFIVGLLGGLLFGMFQAILLPWHKRLWWVMSALAWAFGAALVLAVVNTAEVMVGGR